MEKNIYCFLCKQRTSNKNYTTEERLERANCGLCDRKKCRYMPGVKGYGVAEMQVYARYAKLAYNNKGERGQLEIPDLSDNEVAVFNNAGTIIIAFRGTTLTTSDLVADARIAFGTFLQGSRFKRSLRAVKEVIRRFPNNKIVLVGHSLGGAVAHNIGIIMGLESHVFNIGSSPIDIPTNFIEQLKCKYGPENACNITDKQKIYHTKGDPISLSALSGGYDTHKITKKKGLDPHTIDNFIAD